MTPVEVTMPRLSDSMEEGTVAKWLVELGAQVDKGQPLVEIDTDKATMEYESEAAGVLFEIVVSEGETAPIGALIARIGAPGEEPAAATAPPPSASPPPQASPARASSTAPPAAGGARGNVSPVARRLAQELGVDLETLPGSGPGGSITKADVERAASAGPAEAPKDGRSVVEPSRLQRTIARRMVEGHAAPDFAVEVEIDMTACLELRASLGQDKPSLNDLVVKAVASALLEFPRLNGAYTDEGFVLYERVNIGIAVATEDGLIVPVIRDCERKPLAAIAAEARDLAGKVRDGTITPAELDGGTFTVTNLGMFGVRRFVPILNPPQAGILSVGAVAKQPVVEEGGKIVPRDLASVTLVCDHRIVYGAEAARFLSRIRELLEEPERLSEPRG